MGSHEELLIRLAEDWAAIAELCDLVAARLRVVSATTARAIRSEVTDYAEHVPPDDLEAAVHEHLTMMMSAIRDRRGATDAEIAGRVPFGQRRAAQGVSADAMLRAFYIGYREIWRALQDEARRHPDPGMVAALLPSVDVAFAWVQDFTAALVAIHHVATAAQRSAAAANRQRLVELVAAGDTDAPACHASAQALDLDIDGSFQAFWFADEAHGAISLHADDGLALLPPRCVPGRHGAGVVILAQGVDAAAVVGLVHDAVADVHVGIGLARAGLRGAHDSIVDAALAGAVARRRLDDCDYATDWPVALAMDMEERVMPLLADAVRVARSHPHLAAAVLAFADGGFSVSAAARALHVHPNTLGYRLERWRQLSGRDVRARAGLIDAIVACEIAGLRA